MTRKRNRKRRLKRRDRNLEKEQKLLALPTGGGPFAERSEVAFRGRRGDAVNDLLHFKFDDSVPIPTDEDNPTEGVRERAAIQRHLLKQVGGGDLPN